MLEQFLKHEDASRVREVFAGLWGFEDTADPETQKIIQQAIEAPERFVLKPQREGGGNNLYGTYLESQSGRIFNSAAIPLCP